MCTFHKSPYYLLYLSSICLLLISSSSSETNERGGCDDYADVYSVIIDSVEKNMRNGTSSYDEIAILDSTKTFRFEEYPTTPDSSYFIKKMPELDATTFQDFLHQNIKKEPLSKYLTLTKQIPCNRDDPDARCLQLSNIGFDASCNQALVSYTYICGRGSHCGYEKFILLEKKNNRWNFQNEFTSYEI